MIEVKGLISVGRFVGLGRVLCGVDGIVLGLVCILMKIQNVVAVDGVR